MVRVRKRPLFWKHGSITPNKDEKHSNVLSKYSVVCCSQILVFKHWCVGRQPSHMMLLSLSCHSSPDVKQLIYYLIWAWHDTCCRKMFKHTLPTLFFSLYCAFLELLLGRAFVKQLAVSGKPTSTIPGGERLLIPHRHQRALAGSEEGSEETAVI